MKKQGFSIIEMLIAIAIFATVFAIATQSLATSLKNSKKSESMSKARENVDYSISTMERLLRNAQDITSCTSTQLTYVDEYGNTTQLTCNSGGGYIASGSAGTRLTSTDVTVDCSGTVFSCPAPAVNVPESVFITITAEDANLGSGAEGASVTSQTKVQLRNYSVF